MYSSPTLITPSLFQSWPGRGTNSLIPRSGWGGIFVGVDVLNFVGVRLGVRVTVGVRVGVGVCVGFPQTVNVLNEFWGSLGSRWIKSAALLFESTQLPPEPDLRS